MVSAAKEKFIYSPEFMVKGFARVSSDIVKTASADLVVKWYRASYIDLQVWLDKEQNKVIRQQFSFLGLVVEWNHIQGLKTGYVEDQPENSKKGTTVSVVYDKKFEPESIKQAIEVLTLAKDFAEKYEVIQNYKNAPMLSKWQSFLLITKHLFKKNKNIKKS